MSMNITKKVDNQGTICYYNEQGQLHREDGPAIEYADGDKAWYINDIEYSEQEFNNFFLRKRLQKILEL